MSISPPFALSVWPSSPHSIDRFMKAILKPMASVPSMSCQCDSIIMIVVEASDVENTCDLVDITDELLVLHKSHGQDEDPQITDVIRHVG